MSKAGLKRLKRLSGLTWDGVADLVGANRSTIFRWLSGDSEMKDEKADLISHLVAEYERPRNKTDDETKTRLSEGPASPATPLKAEKMPGKEHPAHIYINKELNNKTSPSNVISPKPLGTDAPIPSTSSPI
ncbi:unnamed protein product, partial [marine sediment metagenome]